MHSGGPHALEEAADLDGHFVRLPGHAAGRGKHVAGALAGLLGVRDTMLVMTALSFVGVAVAWTSPLRRAVVEPTAGEPASAA